MISINLLQILIPTVIAGISLLSLARIIKLKQTQQPNTAQATEKRLNN